MWLRKTCTGTSSESFLHLTKYTSYILGGCDLEYTVKHAFFLDLCSYLMLGGQHTTHEWPGQERGNCIKCVRMTFMSCGKYHISV